MFSASESRRQDANRSEVMTLERILAILSGLLLLVGLVLLWRNSLSAAFVIATLGVVAWFLSFRAQLRTKMAADAPTKTDDQTDEN